MEMNKQRWLADQLEKHAGGQEAELPAGLARLSGALRQAMGETQPRPGFVNELAEQIQIQQRAAPPAGAVALWLWRLLAGAAGTLALIAFALFVSGLFSRPAAEQSLSAPETALPPVVLQGESGPFAGVEFRLREPLPAEVESLALYRAELAPLPETAEAARELARRLGMEEPAVYRVGEGWLAEDEAGRRLTIDPTAMRFPIIYQAQSDPVQVGPVFIPPSAVARAAAFLEAGGLLPADYEKRERLEAPGFGRMLVEIIPLLDGRPVHYGASELVVDPDAGIVAARIRPLRFTPTGEQVTALSGQEAIASVLQSGGIMDVAEVAGSVFAGAAVPLDAASPYQMGQEVQVTGVVGGSLQVEDDQVVPRITLAVATDDDPTTEPVIYPLTGPWATLMDISRHYQLHVTAFVTVVAAEEGRQGPQGQALQIDEDSWWRTWPDEKVETLLGHLEMTTRDGREVRLFVEEATGARYVDARLLTSAEPGDLLPSDQPGAGDPVWVAGVVNPDPNATYGGLPILSIFKQQELLDRSQSPGAWLLDLAMPRQTAEPSPAPAALSNTLMIDWAVLGYTVQGGGGQALQPAWLFYGYSSDERLAFVLQAPAVPGIALAGSEWQLEAVRGAQPLEGTAITLEFERARVSGSAGCNSYFGDYNVTGNRELTIPEVARTLIDCDEPAGILEQEAAYITALTSAATYQIVDGRLEIRDGAGDIILLFRSE